MSSSIQEKFGRKMPWLFGKSVRIPKVNFPEYREGQMTLPTPGRSLILIAIYIFLFWLMAGGIYLNIRGSIALGQDNAGQVMWLYPTTSEAFIIESIVAAVLMFLGGVGFIILYQSTKHAYNYSYAVKLLIIGMTAVVTGFGLLQYMIAVKSGTFKT
ncbi:MAG: hypothetical protein E4G98_01470 [Promethearchaeota archaeon]|nr:MAG: hypothetical protein E4G98_01470 [Candidatus Lokiarchaeota archaeon]